MLHRIVSILENIPLLRWPQRRLESLYERAIRALWRVEPTDLFDADYYLTCNHDVAVSGVRPLFHFLRYGAQEGRKPHPLFDPQYYIQHYPDVARSKLNPLIHFLRFGGAEGRQPHPAFDSAYYLAANPDVAEAKANPLVHFLNHGASEGRSPHSGFDPGHYLRTYPDVAAAGINPLIHFVLYGSMQGRTTRHRRSQEPASSYLPADVVQRRARAPEEVVVDVIIPVYRGYRETRDCIESVLSSNGAINKNIVVINDASPDCELTQHLHVLEQSGAITLIENPSNYGFVRSANLGMSLSERDVVLLNSDTVVFNGWLDRLWVTAQSGDRTGTVTPFSNNATICSYPVSCADNLPPSDLDLAELDSIFAKVNAGRTVEIPTAVGCCMYIRRDCLREVGIFDEQTFGAGYGEENDFSRRAVKAGWRNVLACDVFVYHAGAVSFGNVDVRQQAAMRALLSKHPDYLDIVRWHIEADPSRYSRLAVTAYRLKRRGRVALAVTHALSGGVSAHIDALTRDTRGSLTWLILSPSAAGQVRLECKEPFLELSATIDPYYEYEELTTLLKACGVRRVHVHHTLGYGIDLVRLIDELDVPFDFTVHDYRAICPFITLSDVHGRYCGEPGVAGCNECIRQRSPHLGMDIQSWRAAHAWLLMSAERVITPSADSAARIRRYYPHANIVAAEHSSGGAMQDFAPVRLRNGEQLRIAVLGVVTAHKGLEQLARCVELATESRLSLEFRLIGAVDPSLRAPAARCFSQTGPYDFTKLPSLLEEVRPHLVWFPGQVPETFSYTLSTCLEMGLPVAVPEIGAFPERVGERPWSWVLPWDAEPAAWIAFFLRIRENFTTGAVPPLPPRLPRAISKYYDSGGFTAIWDRPYIRASTRPKAPVRAVAVASTNANGQIQACGYVRVVQPLTHPCVADILSLTVTMEYGAGFCNSDLVLAQRVAVRDMETAHRILEQRRKQGGRLIFEIDDDLFRIPPNHPEHDAYERAIEPAKLLAECADAVTTSTGALQRALLSVNPNTVVIPNYLDERLWDLTSPPPLDQEVGPTRFLFAGTSTHRDDLFFLEPVMARLQARHGRRVEFYVLGVADESSDARWFRRIPVPSHAATSYPQYVAWLQQHRRFHWGLAPLLDTEFNQCKSPLKVYEYSALGLPAICSDVKTYRQAVTNDFTGVLAANDSAAWFEVLDRAVIDRAWRNRIAEAGHDNVKRFTIAARAEELRAVWKLLSRPATLVSAQTLH